MMPNENKLKALAARIAKEENSRSDIVLRNYFYERFLMRLFRSPAGNEFLVKGGFLLEHQAGLRNRSTRDLDLLIALQGKNFLDYRDLASKMSSACNIDLGDEISFSLVDLRFEMKDILSGGCQVRLHYRYGTIADNISIDVSTNDLVFPNPVEETIRTLDGSKMTVIANAMENSIADKIHSVFSRGLGNTRMKDFYDLALYQKLFAKEMDPEKLAKAIDFVFYERRTNSALAFLKEESDKIRQSKSLAEEYLKFQKSHPFAQATSFEECLSALDFFVGIMEKEKRGQGKSAAKPECDEMGR